MRNQWGVGINRNVNWNLILRKSFRNSVGLYMNVACLKLQRIVQVVVMLIFGESITFDNVSLFEVYTFDWAVIKSRKWNGVKFFVS